MRPTTCAGFTLIEIAIVLVIVGLLLGGILKVQELITGARVRNLISQQDGTKAAFFGFQDRFRALPGDFAQASTTIDCIPVCSNGNGNGQVTASGTAGATIDEFIAAWEHLSKAGFINGSYTYAASPETTTSAPVNPYSRYIQFVYDNVYDGSPTACHNIKTGNQVPSEILAEVDRKIDDGSATGGEFRFSVYAGGAGGTAPVGSGTCYVAASPFNWTTVAPRTNCGGASLL
ncbi:MAG TPA: prepilin-type N-terminal cleavage/methylation domain-containing protein [Burkholderiales bacterium]|jgi:prepilin-type N-terminal cleavage/methylation domain-containing protein|nr:prepilin-type N-terminal cleavage/methylation domain-containing protein [Burkholderiales bacterium]